MIGIEPTPSWFVVKTNPRAEVKVNLRLIDAGFTTFLPTHTVIKAWSDRKKKIKQVLIPSTLFVQANSIDLKEVYPIRGVHNILKFLGKPAIVKDHEIEILKILIENVEAQQISTIYNYKKGELIEVLKGPFQGLIANVLEDNTRFRLIIEIESLGSGFVINVPKSYVKKRIEKRA